MASVAFTAAALDDIAEALDWYEHQAPGLGKRLVAEVDAAVAPIAANPSQYALAYGQLRRHPRGWRARG